MIKHLVITDKVGGSGDIAIPDHPERMVISATDFIAGDATANLRHKNRLKVINLCANYDYLSKGYYVSLLTEARGMRCVPPVADIVALNWKRNYQSSLPELQELLAKHYHEPPDEPLERTYSIFFGRVEKPGLEQVARRLFDLFRFPLMKLQIRYGQNSRWEIESIAPLSLSGLPKERHDSFYAALEHFTGMAWRKPGKKAERHWIAILHDPKEKMPPSNKKALEKFARIGKKMGLFIDLITRTDYSILLEYDALFIRETTAINHHTYRFANKAELEDIPSIDDPASIIRCCNKVFQHELLVAQGVAVPRTIVMDKRMEKGLGDTVNYPAVVKIPDGSFSRGVIRVDDEKQFHAACQELFKHSEIILCQEFVNSDFDWRIGVLGGKPLFACKYFMAEGHWQIYNHTAKARKAQSGDHICLPVEEVPEDVMATAIKAAKLIGNGLYGVDLKQTENGPVIMEVNDNPNIDAGVEDEILGDELYHRILTHIVEMIEA